ncbi:hypothetical protein A176_006185 [Myxococcus hansupus]|uniref:Uncharacterized protein n=1 Tax=Pseudomyxococcus hansupus TaxID=1297742 RepID=A0A0H4X5V2_9BACT|nr:hypothetical protein [Myxococcus hansupus]AKQ69273.1 hypothetical protein A176_006185 [Myxococcus hansupus]
MTQTKVRKAGAVLGAVGLLLASTAVQAQVSVAGKGGPIRLEAGEQSVELSLDGSTVRGPGIELHQRGAAWVGHVRDSDVDVGWDGGSLLGRVGEGTVALQVLPRTPEPGLRLEGNFASQPSSLIVAPFAIAGTMGGCDYTLSVTAGRYAGWRTCQPGTTLQPGPVSLTLPEEVLALDTGEKAALLALVLSERMLP